MFVIHVTNNFQVNSNGFAELCFCKCMNIISIIIAAVVVVVVVRYSHRSDKTPCLVPADKQARNRCSHPTRSLLINIKFPYEEDFWSTGMSGGRLGMIILSIPLSTTRSTCPSAGWCVPVVLRSRTFWRQSRTFHGATLTEVEVLTRRTSASPTPAEWSGTGWTGITPASIRLRNDVTPE